MSKNPKNKPPAVITSLEGEPIRLTKKERQPMTFIEPAAFCLAWQRSTSAAACAAELGITEESAASRAVRLRKMGVGLKKFTTRSSNIDVDALNKLVSGA